MICRGFNAARFSKCMLIAGRDDEAQCVFGLRVTKSSFDCSPRFHNHHENYIFVKNDPQTGGAKIECIFKLENRMIFPN